MNKAFIAAVLFTVFYSVDGLAPKCTDCGGLGVCQTNGICRCYPARFSPTVNGTKMTHLCSRNIYQDNPTGVVVLRVVSAAISFILMSLILWRLFLEFRHKSVKVVDTQPGVRKVVKFSLITDGFICFLMFLLSALDYWGLFNILPYGAYNAIYYFIDWLYVLLFTVMLLHWAEIYQVTMKSIKTRDMMKKVNSNYVGELTIEEVMTSLTFLQRFKIPFLAITGASFIMWLARTIGGLLISNPFGWIVFFAFANAFYACVWLGCGVAFFIYGYRLIKLMPETMSAKIKSITSKMVIILILQIINSVQIVALNSAISTTAQSIYSRNSITFAIRIVVSFMILEIYMPLGRIKVWFSTSLLRSSTNGTGTSGDSKVKEVEVKATPSSVSNMDE
ncbi:hypothetical protein PROFUN_11531 [Planoprotostelium fungivorum]|uniref:THH1/TOM1/TOM3 domain-containing protein n=1 Tax=Planoprotostelium fungivorum TaxID=1890364 RepID=A0A2P6NA06_9EUKA|nr:hypothetical protein PROFUN_11531 [Planoprotostelium fungivorum]